MGVGAVIGAAGLAATIAFAPGAVAAPAPGKACSPKGAVLQADTQTLLCAQTPSDSRFRWRVITIQGPLGPAGPGGAAGAKGDPGPQGAPGPAGTGQTAHWVTLPVTPDHYDLTVLSITKESVDGVPSNAYLVSYASDDTPPTHFVYDVPGGAHVLRVQLVVTRQRSTFTGYVPFDEKTIELTGQGATSFTWDGTPIDATTFATDVDFYESADCRTISDPEPGVPCGSTYDGEYSQVLGYTYTLRTLISD